jgi:hypothetical protein
MRDSVTLWEIQEQKAVELSRKLQLKSEECKRLNGELNRLEKLKKERK